MTVFFIGLTNGAVYALVALGYTLVYGILELINFAHGDVFMLGGMISATFLTSRLQPRRRARRSGRSSPAILVSLVAAMVICGLLNATIEFVAYKPLRSAPRLAPLITAIGMSFILQDIALAWKGPEYVSLPAILPRQRGLQRRRRRLHVEQAHRRDHHRAGAPRADVARAQHEAGQGDARDGPGQGRGGDDGHQRQPHDLVHVPDRRRARRRSRPALRPLLHAGALRPGLPARPDRVHRRRPRRHRQPARRRARRARDRLHPGVQRRASPGTRRAATGRSRSSSRS